MVESKLQELNKIQIISMFEMFYIHDQLLPCSTLVLSSANQKKSILLVGRVGSRSPSANQSCRYMRFSQVAAIFDIVIVLMFDVFLSRSLALQPLVGSSVLFVVIGCSHQSLLDCRNLQLSC